MQTSSERHRMKPTDFYHTIIVPNSSLICGSLRYSSKSSNADSCNVMASDQNNTELTSDCQTSCKTKIIHTYIVQCNLLLKFFHSRWQHWQCWEFNRLDCLCLFYFFLFNGVLAFVLGLHCSILQLADGFCCLLSIFDVSQTN